MARVWMNEVERDNAWQIQIAMWQIAFGFTAEQAIIAIAEWQTTPVMTQDEIAADFMQSISQIG